MAEFLPNLDDGELWLPSNIFPPDEMAETPSKFDPNLQCLTAYDDLLQYRHAQTSLKPHTYLTSNSEWFRPAAQDGSTAVLKGGVVRSAYSTGNIITSFEPDYKYSQFLNPDQFQRQQSRVLGSRVWPFQQSGGLGYGREHRGTGVFIPRGAAPIPHHVWLNDARRRQGAIKRKENQVNSYEDSMKKFETRNKRKECHNQQVPPEMALPQEWTY